jgi:tetratricopeptide (TPR) repeat protein
LSRPLTGQLVVFTGKLSSLGRKQVRALVARLGGATAEDVTVKTTMLVIGGEGFSGSSEKTQNLRRAEELNEQQPSRIAILSEDQFCTLAGVPTVEELKRQYHATRDLLVRYPSLREEHVRYLVKWGIVQPVLHTNADTFFDFSSLGVIKQVHDDISQGLSFHRSVRTLLASRSGQLSFDFRLDAAPAKILTLQQRRAPSPPAQAELPPPVRDARLAEEYFKVGSAMDNGDEATVEQAATAYRRALELDPYLVAAIINLANIHYGRDELAEAQALYERAIGLESDFFEAHFNLGNIYHDLNRFPEAQACYETALRLNPFYADTHFYLAVTLEKMGRSELARPHWRSYQQLAPEGEWADLAKEFSD